jgi:L-ascorbate metabolism protein UlaG (beta-lactamase superfamily)
VVTAWETADLLRFWRYRGVHQMRWGEQARIGPATVRAFEVNHWGARVRTDTYRGYNGYRVDVGRYRILFAGDTADTHLFRSLKCSRPYDVAVMPIGAYNPWRRHHCTPEQAWKMANDAATEFVVPVHHQTFILSDEPVSEPLERFYHAAARHPDRIALDSIGQEFHLV